MIKRIIVCDVCSKEEDFDNPWRKRWFIENISYTICSKECFEKRDYVDKVFKKLEKIRKGFKQSRYDKKDQR